MKRLILKISIDHATRSFNAGRVGNWSKEMKRIVETLTTMEPGVILQKQDNEHGSLAFILPVEWEQDQFPADFKEWTTYLENQGLDHIFEIEEGPRPERLLQSPRIGLRRSIDIIIYTKIEDDTNIQLSRRNIYYQQYDSEAGYYFTDDGLLSVACLFYHPGMGMNIWHHVCNLPPQTDILDCLDIRHDD